MKFNKEDGITFLEQFKIPTIQKINIDDLLSGKIPIKNGLSVRVSPKDKSQKINVYLPSIHNCKDINEIKAFIDKYKQKYKIFIHETVNPETIGSVSKLDFRNSIVIETYKNFDERKKEIINNRVIIPLYGEKMMISKLEMEKKDKDDYRNFKKVIYCLNDIPFSNYDMEYVIQDGEVIFTDLTLPDNSEYLYLKEYLDEKDKER